MRSLVDLGQEFLKDRPGNPRALQGLPRRRVLERHDFVVRVLFVLGINLLESQLCVELLDFDFLGRSHLALAVVLVQKFPLFVIA